MPANSALFVTGLSFDTIRNNLRNFISAKPDFQDYDFEDSALGTLLDLLAYNTYYSAFYANMSTNESFLDSAQLYDSVASHAKTLGYTPVSAAGAVANISIVFPSVSASVSSVTIAKNTEFTSTINGVSYLFVTPKTYTVTSNSTGGFQRYINLVEGNPLTHRFLYTTANTSFVLPNANTEVSSITVSAVVDGQQKTFVPASDLFSVNALSKIFYVEADKDRLYKVSFGDDILGIKPDNNSLVTINYRVCNGIDGNGARTFNGPGTIDGYNDYIITLVTAAADGATQEDIESVRYNAPKNYTIQNRAVTKYDYSSLILQQNPDISSVSVWGGEENIPPIYGKVYAAVKPKVGTLISQSKKDTIVEKMREFNLVSMDLEVVDATYLYISPKITARYNPTNTSLTPSQIGTAVGNRVISYESNNLNLFDKKFRFNAFLNFISLADTGIEDMRATIDIRKRFSPSTVNRTNYTLSFNQDLRRLGTPDQAVAGSTIYGFVASTEFTYLGQESYFDDDGYGTLRIYYFNSVAKKSVRIYTNKTAGTIDYENGKIEITNFLPEDYDEEIIVSARPILENVEPIRNQILLIDNVSIQVVNDLNGIIEATIKSVNTIGSSTSLSAVTSEITGITTY